MPHVVHPALALIYTSVQQFDEYALEKLRLRKRGDELVNI